MRLTAEDMAEATLRDVTDEDRDQIVPIIVAAYASIGQKFYLQTSDQDMQAPATHYRRLGGRFVVLEEDGRIIGTIAALPADRARSEATIRRLYLREEARGKGHGKRLVEWALQWAKEQGFTSFRLWTDVLFTRAHAFYEGMGFTQTGVVRTMHDCDEPYREYEFTFTL